MITIKLEVSVLEAEMFLFGLKRVHRELNDAASKTDALGKESINHAAGLYEELGNKLRPEIEKQKAQVLAEGQA